MPALTGNPAIRTAIALVLLASLADTGPLTAEAAVSVQSTNFRGWENAVELTNSDARVVVVPSIGRIMFYAQKDKSNLLWINPALEGVVRAVDTESMESGKTGWINYGGDKTWPTPESLFPAVNGRSWPPDHYIDGGSYQFDLLKDGVEIRSPVSEYSGVRVIRRIQLANLGTRLTIRQSLEKVKKGKFRDQEPIPLTIWSVTQIRNPREVLFPISSDSHLQNRYYVFPFEPRASENLTTLEDYGKFVPSLEYTQKIGTDSKPWVAAVSDQVVFAQFFSKEPESEYPDGGLTTEIYTSPQYTELELLSPLRRLETGEKLESTIHWELLRLPGSLRDDELSHHAVDLVRKAAFPE